MDAAEKLRVGELGPADCRNIVLSLARRARKLLGGLDDPEEIESAAWWAVGKAIDLYRPGRGAKLSTWMFGAGWWQLLAELKRGRRGREIREADRPAPPDRDTELALSPAREGRNFQTEARAFAELLDVLELGPRQRRLLELRFGEALSMREIARLLGGTPDTIGKQLGRALTYVRFLLRGRPGFEGYFRHGHAGLRRGA